MCILHRRLKEALRVLAELKREYGNRAEFYQDQLDWVAALREQIKATCRDKCKE